MKKVYLAKSNRSNPNLVLEVRKLLSQYDIEIVEFGGGEYSSKPLLSCDELIIIPEPIIPGNELAIIGKGLYTQIKEFSAFNKSSNFENIIIVTNDNLDIAKIESIELLDINNYISTASMYLKELYWNDTLRDYCYGHYSKKPKELFNVSEIEQTNKTITSYIYAVAKIAQNNVKKT